jgi:hypothetical protein
MRFSHLIKHRHELGDGDAATLVHIRLPVVPTASTMYSIPGKPNRVRAERGRHTGMLMDTGMATGGADGIYRCSFEQPTGV